MSVRIPSCMFDPLLTLLLPQGDQRTNGFGLRHVCMYLLTPHKAKERRVANRDAEYKRKVEGYD